MAELYMGAYPMMPVVIENGELFVLRNGFQVERLVQVCYNMGSEKTEHREIASLVECAQELNCRNKLLTFNEIGGVLNE